MSVWTTDDIGDLSGTRVVVTGATGGLGLATSTALARHGAELVLTARDAAKAHAAMARLRAEVPEARVSTVPLDLADLGSVAQAARHVLATYDGIDILVNNAGVMATPRRSTVDGYELQIGTNHLGHFAFTAQLWPVLRESGARVVSVASLAHRLVKGIDLDSLSPVGAVRRYRRWRSYGESKLANLVFAFELDRRVRAARLDVVSVAAHPGLAATELTASGPSLGGFSIGGAGMHQVSRIVAQPAAQGALPLLRAATDDLPGGSYVGPAGLRETRGRPVLVGSSAASRDERLGLALWAASETAAGVQFTV